MVQDSISAVWPLCGKASTAVIKQSALSRVRYQQRLTCATCCAADVAAAEVEMLPVVCPFRGPVPPAPALLYIRFMLLFLEHRDVALHHRNGCMPTNVTLSYGVYQSVPQRALHQEHNARLTLRSAAVCNASVPARCCCASLSALCEGR